MNANLQLLFQSSVQVQPDNCVVSAGGARPLLHHHQLTHLKGLIFIVTSVWFLLHL